MEVSEQCRRGGPQTTATVLLKGYREGVVRRWIMVHLITDVLLRLEWTRSQWCLFRDRGIIVGFGQSIETVGRGRHGKHLRGHLKDVRDLDLGAYRSCQLRAQQAARTVEPLTCIT